MQMDKPTARCADTGSDIRLMFLSCAMQSGFNLPPFDAVFSGEFPE
jgi:hypothetical protein